MRLPFVAASLLATGYLLGSIHAADRVFEWALDFARAERRRFGPGWFVADAVAVLLVLVLLVAHPRRMLRAVRETRFPVLLGTLEVAAVLAGIGAIVWAVT